MQNKIFYNTICMLASSIKYVKLNVWTYSVNPKTAKLYPFFLNPQTLYDCFKAFKKNQNLETHKKMVLVLFLNSF